LVLDKIKKISPGASFFMPHSIISINWPEDFLQTIMMMLKKKPKAVTCEEYRTMSLLTHASKILLKVIASSGVPRGRGAAFSGINVKIYVKIVKCTLKAVKCSVKEAEN